MMLNAMLWVARSGAPWRDLPKHYGSWKAVYTRFRRWKMVGLWQGIWDHVSIEPDFEHILALIEDQQGHTIIPSRKHRKARRDCDWWLYKECWYQPIYLGKRRGNA